MADEGKLSSQLVLGKSTWFRYALAQTTASGVYLSWDIFEDIFNINDPPFIFTVLRGTEFTEDPAAFTEVSPPLENIYTYTDTTGISIGKWVNYFYMIKLATSLKVVYSSPTAPFGGVSDKQRNIVKAAIRRAHVSARHMPTMPCILLKRRYTGTVCSCRDPITKEVLNPDCATCYGTGIVGGYYQEGSEKTILTTTPLNSLPAFDTSVKTGSMTQSKMVAKFAGLPPIRRGDVFVNTPTNRRFYVTGSQVSAEVQGFPVIQDMELQLADYKDIIYSFSL